MSFVCCPLAVNPLCMASGQESVTSPFLFHSFMGDKKVMMTYTLSEKHDQMKKCMADMAIT